MVKTISLKNLVQFVLICKELPSRTAYHTRLPSANLFSFIVPSDFQILYG